MFLNGIIVVDKPADWTSHDVVAKLRGALRGAARSGEGEAHISGGAAPGVARPSGKAPKVGHGGTLDPMATGVLPVFTGRATRAAEFAENAEKEYVAGVRLGVVTDTQDITGNTISVCEPDITAGDFAKAVRGFVGAQTQIPPMYSAIKINGKKLYEMARRGVDVPRTAREILISDIELLDGEKNEFTLRIVCSKGTYIRTLCHDIGAALGCGGAMSSLRRTRAGMFGISDAHTLDEVIGAISSGRGESVMIPVDAIFSGYPAVTLSITDARKCKNGAPCTDTGARDGVYRFYGPDGEFLMLGEAKAGNVRTLKSFFGVTANQIV